MKLKPLKICPVLAYKLREADAGGAGPVQLENMLLENKVISKTCRWCRFSESFESFGAESSRSYCSQPKVGHTEEKDSLTIEYLDSFHVGPDFGCVHWQQGVLDI